MDEDGREGSPRTTESGGGVPLDVIPLHSTNLLTVLDENGVVQYESPSIERIFGFDQDELVGEQVADYFHPDDRAEVLDAFRTVVESEEYAVESVEYRHERADGSYLWVESVASADPTPAGHYVVNTRDVSRRKAREQELERTNDRLDEFAGVVSHDLRNPLNVASARLEMARTEHDSEHLEVVERAHGRMESRIDGLLTLARVGDDATEFRLVELAPLSRECWQNVETADATLRVETDAVVRADEERFRQLLENLFRNAIEHGGEDVTVTVGELAEGSGIYVGDDGPGIPEPDRERVFESGYSTGDTGTGLGLAIVEEIAIAHDWDVLVTESEPGGARFDIAGVEVVER